MSDLAPPPDPDYDDSAPDIPEQVLDELEARHGHRSRRAAVAASSRVPPHNLAAERSLLGAALLSAKAVEAAVGVVGPDDFYRPAHGHIWHAIGTLAAGDQPVDTVTVAAQLGTLLDTVGGPAQLVSLIADTPATSNAGRYARIVADHATLRRLIRLAGELTDQAYLLPSDPADAVADAIDALEQLETTHGDRLGDHLVSGPAVLDLPAPEPLIADIVNLDSFAVLYGRPGSGKSFLALDMALCVASGTWWHGHQVHQGNVLYVAAEGAAGLGIRARAWAAVNRVRIPDGITWLTRPANLLDADQTRQLLAICRRLEPVLVVIDTLNRSMPGGDENSSTDMGAAIAACDRIRHTTSSCVQLVHHSGKDQAAGLRGHSSLRGAVDTELEVRNGGDNIIGLATSKQKEGPAQGLPLRFSLVPAAGSVAVSRYTSRVEQGAGLTPNGVAVLDALTRIATPAGVSGPIWRDAAIDAGVSRTQFYEQLKNLVDRGAVNDVSTTSRPAYVPKSGTGAPRDSGVSP